MQQIKKILFILILLISSLVSQVLAEGVSCYRSEIRTKSNGGSVLLDDVNVEGELSDHQRNMQNYVTQHIHYLQSEIMHSTILYPIDFIATIYDFLKTYSEMRTANWVNSDKYFHSKANYKASQRGAGGYRAAKYISNVREIFDQKIKGDSRQSSIDDQKANMYGRNLGWQYRYKTNNPNSILTKYRPHNLPKKY